MRKFYLQGGSSPFSSASNSRSPSPTLQISLPHRFQPRQAPKRPLIRWILVILLLLGLYTLTQYTPTQVVRHHSPDNSFFLGEEIPSVRFYDLTHAGGSSKGWERDERILICVPLRDAAGILPHFFSHMRNLTYPHHLMDLAFLVSDSKDTTMQTLLHHLSVVQQSPLRFNRAIVFEKDFGQAVGQAFSDRHGFE